MECRPETSPLQFTFVPTSLTGGDGSPWNQRHAAQEMREKGPAQEAEGGPEAAGRPELLLHKEFPEESVAPFVTFHLWAKGNLTLGLEHVSRW